MFSNPHDMRTGQTCNPQVLQKIYRGYINLNFISQKLTGPLDLLITKLPGPGILLVRTCRPKNPSVPVNTYFRRMKHPLSILNLNILGAQQVHCQEYGHMKQLLNCYSTTSIQQ